MSALFYIAVLIPILSGVSAFILVPEIRGKLGELSVFWKSQVPVRDTRHLIFLNHLRMKRLKSKERAQIIEQLPDAIKALAVCYGAGLTLFQSFEQASVDMPEPCKSKFEGIVADIVSGKSIAEALENFRDELSLSPVSYLTSVLEIQQRCGGSLETLLFRAADSVSASLELQRSLKVQTAQSKMSYKVVMMIPILLLSVMTLSNPEYLTGFFSTAQSAMLFFLACAMEFFGILIIRRILDVDVG